MLKEMIDIDRKDVTANSYKDYPAGMGYMRSEDGLDIVCEAPHWHDVFELYIVKKGYIYITVKEKEHKICAPAMLLLLPKIPHSLRTDNLDYAFGRVRFNPLHFLNGTQGSKQFLEPLGNFENFELHIPKAVITDEKLFSIALQLDDACSYWSRLNPLISEGFLLALIGQLFEGRHLVFKTRVKNPSQFSDVLGFVEEHFTENISAKSVAELFGYNESYFSHRFKKLFGISFSKFIMRRRLEYACKLMNTTHYTVSECATLCGFSDSNYFSVCFKKKFSITPTEYKAIAQYKNQIY